MIRHAAMNWDVVEANDTRVLRAKPIHVASAQEERQLDLLFARAEEALANHTQAQCRAVLAELELDEAIRAHNAALEKAGRKSRKA